ncbi:MAG: glycosyltransferase [Rubripirellula sp.]
MNVSKRKRVLLMISSMRGGGSEQQTLLLLRHLDRTQFEPSLYLIERDGDLLGRIPEDVAIHSFDQVKSDSGFYYPGRVLRHQQKHLASVLGREHIDVIYDRTFHMTMIAGPPAAKAGIPRISTIVSPPDRALPLVETRFVGLKRKRLANAYRQSCKVIAVSRQAAESAQLYYGLSPDAIEVIHNPVDVLSVQRAAGRSERIENQPFTLVCVGRMTAEKGQADLIHAVVRAQIRLLEKSGSRLRLQLVGDGSLRGELQRLVDQLRVGQGDSFPAIDFAGAQQNPMPLIATADALVLPSLFEGMPNVILESMALKTPVIATRAGGTIELERDDPTITWAKPSDPDSLANAIVECVENTDAIQAKAAAASQLISEHHNVSTATNRIERLLQDASEA